MICAWADAPSWAKFRAMDRNGKWWWYENKPTYDDEGGTWYAKGLSELCEINWHDTMEARP